MVNPVIKIEEERTDFDQFDGWISNNFDQAYLITQTTSYIFFCLINTFAQSQS